MTGTPQYLLALYLAEQRQSGPIPPSDIAAAVDRSPAATTEMLQRLADRGLVTHTPYEGAALTDEGRDTAEQLHETFLTLSRFFRDILDIENHEREAMCVTGTISPAVADRLVSTLPLEDAPPSAPPASSDS